MESVQSIIDYKWDSFAKVQQCTAFFFHIGYQLCLASYIVRVYLSVEMNDETDKQIEPNYALLSGMAVFLLYPLNYETA